MICTAPLPCYPQLQAKREMARQRGDSPDLGKGFKCDIYNSSTSKKIDFAAEIMKFMEIREVRSRGRKKQFKYFLVKKIRLSKAEAGIGASCILVTSNKFTANKIK